MVEVRGYPITRNKLQAYSSILDFNRTLSVLNYTTNGVAQGIIINLGKIPTALVIFSLEAFRNSARILSNANTYRKNRSIKKRNNKSLTGITINIFKSAGKAVTDHKVITGVVIVSLALVAGFYKGPKVWNFLKNFEYQANLRNSYHWTVNSTMSATDTVSSWTKTGLNKASGLVFTTKEVALNTAKKLVEKLSAKETALQEAVTVAGKALTEAAKETKEAAQKALTEAQKALTDHNSILEAAKKKLAELTA